MRVLVCIFALAAALGAQPITVTSLKCVDQAGNPKTAFTAHGDKAICTVTLSGVVPAGTIIAPYTADSPLVLTPAAVTAPPVTLSVSVGGQTTQFSTPAQTGLLVSAGGSNTVQFGVTWP